MGVRTPGPDGGALNLKLRRYSATYCIIGSILCGDVILVPLRNDHDGSHRSESLRSGTSRISGNTFEPLRDEDWQRLPRLSEN